MEDTLRVEKFFGLKAGETVLILIVMEDTLRVYPIGLIQAIKVCLNPYCNGRYSTRVIL